MPRRSRGSLYGAIYTYVPNPESRVRLPAYSSDNESHNNRSNGNQTVRYQQIYNFSAEKDGLFIAHGDSGYLVEHCNNMY